MYSVYSNVYSIILTSLHLIIEGGEDSRYPHDFTSYSNGKFLFY